MHPVWLLFPERALEREYDAYLHRDRLVTWDRMYLWSSLMLRGYGSLRMLVVSGASTAFMLHSMFSGLAGCDLLIRKALGRQRVEAYRTFQVCFFR